MLPNKAKMNRPAMAIGRIIGREKADLPPMNEPALYQPDRQSARRVPP
jgi:hypothetical protein